MYMLIVSFTHGSSSHYGPFPSIRRADEYAINLRLPDNSTHRVVPLTSPDWAVQWRA